MLNNLRLGQRKNGVSAQEHRSQSAASDLGGIQSVYVTSPQQFSMQTSEIAKFIDTHTNGHNQPAQTSQESRRSRAVIQIGVGGTGVKAITRQKARKSTQPGGQPDNLYYLAFDADTRPVTSVNDDGYAVSLTPKTEFYPLDPVPLNGIKLNRGHHPELVERMGATLDRIPRGYLSGGAAGQRGQGELYVLFHAWDLFLKIYNCLRQVNQRRGDLTTAEAMEWGVDIIFIGSIAGGQGAGGILDIAVLTCEALRKLGEWAEASRMIAVLLTPSAFDPLPYQPEGRYMRPGAHAFMQDLKRYQSGQPLRLRYAGNLQVDLVGPLFDNVIVIEGMDTRAHIWPSYDAVIDMMAHGIDTLFCQPIGRHESAIALPKWEATAQGKLTNLSSMGMVELVWPARQVIKLCMIRQAGQLATHLLATNQVEIPPFPLQDSSHLLQQILSVGDPSQPTLSMPSHIEQAAPDEMPARARAYADAQLQNRFMAEAWRVTEEAAATLEEVTLKALGLWLNQLCDHSNLAAIARGLKLGIRAVQGIRSELQAARALQEEEMQQQNESAKAADRAMAASAESLFIGRRARTVTAVQSYLEARAELARRQLQQHRIFCLAGMLERIAQWLMAREQRLGQTQQRLQQVQAYLKDAKAQFKLPINTPHAMCVIDEQAVDQLYAQYAHDPAVDLQAATGGDMSNLLVWGEAAATDVIYRLLNAVEPAFLPLGELSIEDVLRTTWPQRSAAEWSAILRDQVAAAVNLERAKVPPGAANLVEFFMLGVPKAESSMFTGLDHTVSSMGDPYRIVAMHTVYGIPLEALKAVSEWEHAYLALPPNERALLHTLPDELLASEGHDNAARDGLFVLGQIFDMILDNNNYYTYRPANSLRKSIRLGKGLDNALAAFGEQTQLLVELQQRMKALLSEEGKVAVRNRVLDYLAQPLARSDETTERLLHAAQAYTEQLK